MLRSTASPLCTFFVWYKFSQYISSNNFFECYQNFWRCIRKFFIQQKSWANFKNCTFWALSEAPIWYVPVLLPFRTMLSFCYPGFCWDSFFNYFSFHSRASGGHYVEFRRQRRCWVRRHNSGSHNQQRWQENTCRVVCKRPALEEDGKILVSRHGQNSVSDHQRFAYRWWRNLQVCDGHGWMFRQTYSQRLVGHWQHRCMHRKHRCMHVKSYHVQSGNTKTLLVPSFVIIDAWTRSWLA